MLITLVYLISRCFIVLVDIQSVYFRIFLFSIISISSLIISVWLHHISIFIIYVRKSTKVDMKKLSSHHRLKSSHESKITKSQTKTAICDKQMIITSVSSLTHKKQSLWRVYSKMNRFCLIRLLFRIWLKSET
jgi:hypothetical protein